jgi:3-methyladenine DNA glycosylase AlkD
MAKNTAELAETSAIEETLTKKSLNEFVNAWIQIKYHYSILYDQTLKLVKKNLDEEEIFEWAKQLALRRETKNLACLMLTLGNPYLQHEKEVKEFLLTLGNDANWGTRETAAYAFANVLSKNFDKAYSQFQEWVKHDSENIRRAIVLAVKYVAKAREPEYGEPLLRLIEPLLNDRSVYVRKNLGPFAIGDGLLRAYPKLTMQYVEKWSQSQDEQVLWNVAMTFSAAEGAKHCDEALPILRRLATDERRYVWRAVASALRNLGKRKPEKVKPELKRWLFNGKRRNVAETALHYIERRKQR